MSKEVMQQALEALTALLNRDMRNTCQHESTSRGGAIWEICDDCGAKWADDKGGKPKWRDPKEWSAAGAVITALRAELDALQQPVVTFPVGRARVDSGEVHIYPSVRDASDRDALRDGQYVYASPQAAPAAELDAGGWRPIETAPKDGSLFLCWVYAVRYGETHEGQQYQQDVSQADFCEWWTQAGIPDCGWFEPCCGQIGDHQNVTHWMPLPAAPKD